LAGELEKVEVMCTYRTLLKGRGFRGSEARQTDYKDNLHPAKDQGAMRLFSRFKERQGDLARRFDLPPLESYLPQIKYIRKNKHGLFDIPLNVLTLGDYC
jgi:hypothetical protein